MYVHIGIYIFISVCIVVGAEESSKVLAPREFILTAAVHMHRAMSLLADGPVCVVTAFSSFLTLTVKITF